MPSIAADDLDLGTDFSFAFNDILEAWSHMALKAAEKQQAQNTEKDTEDYRRIDIS